LEDRARAETERELEPAAPESCGSGSIVLKEVCALELLSS
jgi:hypothetical protein